MDFLSTYSTLNENRVLLGLPEFTFREYLAALTLRTPYDRLLCTIIAHFLLIKLNVRPSFLNSCNQALQWYQNPSSRCKKLAFLSNFKDFTDLSLSGRNQLYAQLVNTIYCDFTQKVQENGQLSEKGADIDTFFQLGFDLDGNEWYLFYPDFIVCVGKNAGGCHFSQLFDETHEPAQYLAEWMSYNDFFTFISTSSGLPIAVEENLIKTQDTFCYMAFDNVYYQELEKDPDDSSGELEYVYFHKKFLPSQKLIRLMEIVPYKEICQMIQEDEKNVIIEDIFQDGDPAKIVHGEESEPYIPSENTSDSYSGEESAANLAVSMKEESIDQELEYFGDKLKQFREVYNYEVLEAFKQYQQEIVIDEKELQKTLEKITFLASTKLSLFYLLQPGIIQFMPFILQKSLQKYNITRDMPISIIKINGNHKYLNSLINTIQFKAIHLVFSALKSRISLDVFTHTKSTLSAKNYHTHKPTLINYLDGVYAVAAGFSQYYHDYMHQHNIYMAELRNPGQNFVDDIAPEGPYGQWIVRGMQVLEDHVLVHVYAKPRELSQLAEIYTKIVEKMPAFLQHKGFIPRSPELQALRIFLGYEAPPKPRDPTPPPVSSESSHSADDYRRNQRRGYDFSDSEYYSSYELESTSTTSSYSEPEESEEEAYEDQEYVEYWIYPDGNFSPIKIVKPPFEVETTEIRDFTKPYLVRQERKQYEKEMRKKQRELHRVSTIPKAEKEKRRATSTREQRNIRVSNVDVNYYQALRELREKQRVEMEMYYYRLRGQHKTVDITKRLIDGSKIPEIVPKAAFAQKQAADPKSIFVPRMDQIPVIQPAKEQPKEQSYEQPKEAEKAAEPQQSPEALQIPPDLVIPELNFDFDLK